MDAFSQSLAFTLSQEGGVADLVGDPGGLTNQGLTLFDLRMFAREATPADLLALGQPEVAAIYLTLYWMPVAGWQMPPAIACMTFDHGVNCGVGTSAKILQRRLGVVADGQIGPDTLRAMRVLGAGPVQRLLFQLKTDQLADYLSKSNAARFINGWTARLHARTNLAVSMSYDMPPA